MKIPVLEDLQNEINRLFIAGAKFATNDPRIKKHIPTLTKMGERAPAIKKLADMTQDLVTTQEPDEVLAEVGVYLMAILNTQGNASGTDLTEVDYTPKIKILKNKKETLPETNTPYSTLAPIVMALTQTGSGRLEVLETAYEEGKLNDFRLYKHLSKGLDDKYVEVATILADKIIPSLGEEMLPFLLEDYNVKGGMADVRRMLVIAKIGHENTVDIAETAFNEGNVDMQVAAIPLLGRDNKHEDLLLSLTGDRRLAIKEAALYGLIKMDSQKGKDKMMKILASRTNYRPAIKAAQVCTDPIYNRAIFDIVKNQFDELVAFCKDKTVTKDDKWAKGAPFQDRLSILGSRQDDYIIDFLSTELLVDYQDLYDDVPLYMLYVSGISREIKIQICENVLETILSNNNWKPVEFVNVFLHHYMNWAIHVYSEEKLIEVFAPLHKKGALHTNTYHHAGAYILRLIKEGDKK